MQNLTNVSFAVQVELAQNDFAEPVYGHVPCETSLDDKSHQYCITEADATFC